MGITERIQQIAETVAEIRGDVRVIMARLDQKPDRTEVVQLIHEHMRECAQKPQLPSREAWRTAKFIAYAIALATSAVVAALTGRAM